MAEYELPNGHVLTDGEIERRAKEWESGTWSGHLVTVRALQRVERQHVLQVPGIRRRADRPRGASLRHEEVGVHARRRDREGHARSGGERVERAATGQIPAHHARRNPSAACGAGAEVGRGQRAAAEAQASPYASWLATRMDAACPSADPRIACGAAPRRRRCRGRQLIGWYLAQVLQRSLHSPDPGRLSLSDHPVAPRSPRRKRRGFHPGLR